MELNPEATLGQLISTLNSLRSPHTDRVETLRRLQGLVHKSDIEISNLSKHLAQNPQNMETYRKLIFNAEMARGELPRP